MANGDILSDFGINLLEEEIDDVIFQTNEFLTDATFTWKNFSGIIDPGRMYVLPGFFRYKTNCFYLKYDFDK